MKRKAFRISGLILIIIGITLLYNSAFGITGFTVLEDIQDTSGYVIGIVFIISGIFIILSGRIETSGLEVLAKTKKIQEHLHFTKEEAQELLEGKEVDKLTQTKDYTTETYYKIEGDTLHAVMGGISGPKKTNKYEHAATPMKGLKAMLNFRDEALDLGKELGLKEVDIYGAAIKNKDLYQILKKKGYEDTIIHTGLAHPEDKVEDVEGVVKKFYL